MKLSLVIFVTYLVLSDWNRKPINLGFARIMFLAHCGLMNDSLPNILAKFSANTLYS